MALYLAGKNEICRISNGGIAEIVLIRCFIRLCCCRDLFVVADVVIVVDFVKMVLFVRSAT